jgi:hypothetical protein
MRKKQFFITGTVGLVLFLTFSASVNAGPVGSRMNFVEINSPPPVVTNLENISPGEIKVLKTSAEGSKYAIAIPLSVPEGGSARHFTLSIKNDNASGKGLVQEDDAGYYITCSQSEENFYYQAKGSHYDHITKTSTDFEVNPWRDVLIPGTSYLVYDDWVQPGDSVTIMFWFELKAPFKINGSPTRTGVTFTTNIVYTITYE